MAPQEQGKQAYNDNQPMIDNPYARYTDNWYFWNDGWKQEWWDKANWRPRAENESVEKKEK